METKDEFYAANWQKEQQLKRVFETAESNKIEADRLLEDLIAKKKTTTYTEEEVKTMFLRWFDFPSDKIISFEDWFDENKKS